MLKPGKNVVAIEVAGYNGNSYYMAERTGTLWENVGAYASCNHGFASHVAHTLYRDILGVQRVDSVAKRIAIRFQDLKLNAACLYKRKAGRDS